MKDLSAEVRRQMILRRILAGLTQEELGERMGSTQSGVSALESGRSGLTLRTLERWAQALGTRARVVLEDAPDRE